MKFLVTLFNDIKKRHFISCNFKIIVNCVHNSYSYEIEIKNIFMAKFKYGSFNTISFIIV